MTKQSLIAIAIGSCAATLPLTSCSDSEQNDVTTTATPAIKVFKIRKANVTDIGEWMGYLRGVQDTDLYPRVSGFITSYKEGEAVKAGDVIFQIDPKPFEAELAKAQANLQAAKAALEQTIATRDQLKLDLERYTEMEKTGAASSKQLSDASHAYDAILAKVKACEADIQQQEAAVRAADINLKYTSIKAPYDGFVGTSLISTGALVNPGTKLGNITSAGSLRVDFSINSDALFHSFKKYGQVKSDTRNPELAKQAPPFEILLEDGTVYEHKGELISMNSKVDSTGLIDIVGVVPNPDSKLRGGMKINIRIPLNTKEAILVPKEAIRTVMRNNFILVVDKKNVPHSVPVVIDGYYKIEVKEDSGYVSTQEMVAVTDYNKPLADYFRSFGYDNVEDVPVVADPDNGMIAMQVSSSNSHLVEQKKAAAKAYHEQHESVMSNILMTLGLEAPLTSPDSILPGTITTTAFTYNPVEALTKQKESMQALLQDNPQAKASLPPVRVKTTKLLCRDISVPVDWYGSVRGKEETDIRPQVSGFILEQHFRNGTLVNEGDVLYTIDPAPYEAALASARANLESAQAQAKVAEVELKKAKDDLDRYTKLNNQTPGAVSAKTVTDAQSEVLAKQAAVNRAEATVGQMQAAVKLAEINLGYTTIRAPFSGRAGIGNPSIGALVAPNDATPLVTLSSVNPIRIDFSVSGRDALQITDKVGKNNPNGGMEFDIILEDGSVYPSKGKIVSPDNVVKKTTGTFGIVAEAENADSGLRSGMPVIVRASLNEKKGAYLVPARAPLTSGVTDIVLVVGKKNEPLPLPIKKKELVTMEVDGVMQPMQVIEFDPQMLSMFGIERPEDLDIIVEGSVMAGMALQANIADKGKANKVIPEPFIYTKPRTVEPSVTADQAPTPNLNKF